MADDVQITSGSGTTIATDDIGSGRQVQLVKPVFGADGTATMVAADAPLPTGAGAVMLTGSASANNTDVIASTDVSGYQACSIQLTGTFSAQVTLQWSNDGTNWLVASNQDLTTNGINAPSNGSFGTTTSIYYAVLPGRYVRLRVTSYTSGTVNATVRLSSASPAGITPTSIAVTGPGAFSSTSDAQTVSFWSSVRNLPYGWNGASWDRHRLARIFKSITATSSGDTAVWTPTSGKRFQLLNVRFFATGDAAQSSPGNITVKLRDSTTDIGIGAPVYVPGTGGTLLGGWTSGPIDLGPYGFRSSAINQVLNVNLSAALTAGSIGAIAMGTEE